MIFKCRHQFITYKEIKYLEVQLVETEQACINCGQRRSVGPDGKVRIIGGRRPVITK